MTVIRLYSFYRHGGLPRLHAIKKAIRVTYRGY
jgi:hypothetical protein